MMLRFLEKSFGLVEKKLNEITNRFDQLLIDNTNRDYTNVRVVDGDLSCNTSSGIHSFIEINPYV